MLGEALRLMRVFHDLKTIELAKKLQVSPSHISEIEKGKKTPSLELIGKYAAVFETSPSAILFFAEKVEEKKGGKRPLKGRLRSTIVSLLQSLEKFDETTK